jgi:alcohol dehydrogenase
MSAHRPRGWIRHLATTMGPASAVAGRVALERQAGMRVGRLKAAAADRWRQRRAPTRPRMRALSLAPGARFAWRQVPAPPLPQPGGALVHPIAIATCDLDRTIGLGAAPFPLPLHFGHECVAEVVEVGDGVNGIRPGQRVVVPFQINCGECEPCRQGRTGNCAAVPPISMYGFGVAGGHWGGTVCDLLAVPFAEAMLVPLPDDVDPAAAASASDNLADAHFRVAPYLAGAGAERGAEELLVVGSLTTRTAFSGSVPLYAGQIALALGARRVRFVDARPFLRAQAERLGIEALAPRELDRRELTPLTIDTGATPASLALAIAMTAEDGRCNCIGSLHVRSKIPTALMFARNVTLHLGRSHARSQIPAVLDLLAAGTIRPAEVTTALGSFDDAPRALREHVTGEATKTVLVEG